MSRISFQEQALVPASVDQCVDVAGRTLAEMGSKPQVTGRRLVANLGSQTRMRIVGGAFCPVKWLPIEVTVDVVDGGPQRQVVVNVADRLGVGLMVGMEDKYRSHCSGTAVYVRDTIAAKLVAHG